jgi:hypothetical protein
MNSQKNSVYDAIITVKGSLTKELSRDEFQSVSEIVCLDLIDGRAVFSEEARAKYDTPAKVMAYTRGMVNNWLRKGPELNGGAKYEPKTKKGPQGDAELKALRALAKAHPDNAEVQAELQRKESEIAASKVKKIEIDVEALPEHLRHLVG